MQQLAVPDHVFVCRDGDYVVFLDVRRDRYWALEAGRMRVLANLVRGWTSLAREQGGDSEPTVADARSARLLIEKGLLCEARGTGKDAAPVDIDVPQRELPADGDGTPRVRTAMSFLLAAAFASIAIRFATFEKLIDRARRRKQALAVAATPPDIERVGRLVGAFERLRPLLFSSRDACLLNSLALIEFLARHDVFPQWVFGVQARPFAAHCWVQQDGVLFNDTLEHVRRYTPIMVV